MRHEIHHHALEGLLAHLTVRDGEPRFRHEALEQVPERVNRLDAVVHEIDLSRALQLGPRRPRDQGLIELDDVRLDRETVFGRRLDD